MFKEYFTKVISGMDLSKKEMEEVMRSIMEGKLSESQISGFLVALRLKGETIDEITAAAKVMREKAISITTNKELSIDTCGTGGDGSGTFNISTTVALVLAAAGLTVAKHGNRSVSSKSGSADVLEALGVNLALSPQEVETCIDKLGIGFLFAPNHHKAMKYAIKPRRDLGIRTIFNVLGPLTNPASVNYQILGVFDPKLVKPLAYVLKNLGLKSAMVVNGDGKIDEFTLTGINKIAYLHDGMVEELTLMPEDVGINQVDISSLQGGSPIDNKDIILNILKGKKGPKRDVVLLNTAAAFIVSNLAKSWREGISLAEEIIDSGKALAKLEQLIEYSNSQEVSA
ncbi:anthranilate phosphoribosyltransferase [Natronospora cellulosivora (SeqCode)]